MHEYIEWFNQVLSVAIQLYFRQGCNVDSIEDVSCPANNWMEEVTGRTEWTCTAWIFLYIRRKERTGVGGIFYTEFGNDITFVVMINRNVKTEIKMAENRRFTFVV